MREFEEETNYNRYEYKIIHQYTFKEVIMGINNIMYEHYYYLAKDLTDIDKKKLIIDKTNSNQYEEIKSIKFLVYEEAYKLFNKESISKQTVLIKAHNKIKQYESNNEK